MSENKVSFTITADTKPASKAIIDLQKEFKNLGTMKSVDKGTVQQQRELKKVEAGISQAYKEREAAYKRYTANEQKLTDKKAALEQEVAYTKELQKQYEELEAKKAAGTITPAEINTHSRLTDTIPHRLKEEEKSRNQIATLEAKQLDLEKYSEGVLRHILGDEKEIVKDEKAVLGLKIQKRAVTKDEVIAEDNLAKTAKKTGSAYSSQAKSAKDAGDALVKSTKANTTEIVKGTQLSQAAIEKLRNRAQQVLSKPMGPDKFTRGDLKRREKELLAVQKAMEAAGAPPKELDKEYEQLGIALDQVRQGMSALHKEARSSGKVAAEPVKEIKDEAAEAEQALKRAADQANKVLSQPATTEDTTYGDLKRRRDEIIAAQKSIESVGKPKELDEQYERLQVELVKTDQALNAFNKDVRNTSAIQTEEEALRELQGTMEGIRSSVATVSASMQAEPNTDNIAELIRRYNALREAKQGVEKLGMPTEMDETYATTLRLLAQVSQQIDEYKRKLNGVDTEHKKAGKSVNIFAVALRELRHSLTSIGNGFQGLRRMAGRVRSALNGLSKDMHRSFKQNITRITKYVLGFRSLFFLVRRLRKYLGEGIQNLVKFNNGNNKVNESITRLLSSLLYLKNAWAAAFSPIITAVTPWLEALIDKMAVVGNAVARFIGALTGQTVVFNAVKVQAQDYASTLDNVGSSAGGAADKAKKLKDRLAAFDDLNILGKDDDNDGTGGGGGGGLADAYAPDPNDMFTIVEAQSELADKIKKAWEESGFFGIGHLISQSIADWLGDIDWEDFKDDAQTLGKSFGDFFVGLFGNPDFWSNLGNGAAGLINGLIYAIKGFLDANSGTNYGQMIAEGFNNFLNNTDWKQAGLNLHDFCAGILTNIKEFFDTEDPKAIASSIHDFLEGVDIADIIWKLGQVVVSAAKVIIQVTAELVVEWGEDFGDWLYDKLGGDETAIKVNELVEAKYGDQSSIETMFDYINEMRYWTSLFKAALFGDTTPFQADWISKNWNNLTQGWKDGWATFESVLWDEDGVLTQIGNWAGEVVAGFMAPFDAFKDGGWVETGWQAFKDGWNAFWAKVETWIWGDDQFQGGFAEWIANLGGFGTLYDLAYGGATDLGDGFSNGMQDWWNNMATQWSAGWNSMIEWFKDIFGIHSPSTLFYDFAGDIMQGLWNGLVAAWENIKTFFSNIGTWVSNKWTEIKNKTAEIWTNIKTWLTTTVENIRDKIATVFTVIKSKILYIWESIKEGIKSPINGILGFIEGFVNKCIDGINSLIDKINGIADVEFKNPFNNQTYTLGFNIPKLNNVSIPRLAQGAVIPPNREFMAVLGDQSHGTNVEAPLDVIKQAVAEVLANNGNDEVIRLLQQLIGVVESKNLVIGDKEIGKANARYVKQQTLLRGATY